MSDSPFTLALVTGASSGIGEAIARLLAKKKIPLILTGRNEAKLAALSRELHAEVLPADLSQPAARAKLKQLIRELAPDLVINNAGFGLYGPALSQDIGKLKEMLAVNGEAVMEISLEAAKTLQQRGKKGTILQVSSAAGEVDVFPGFAVYAASKAFVTHFSLSLDAELAPFGIRVLTACPGVITTSFSERAGGSQTFLAERRGQMTSAFAAEEIWRQICLGRNFWIFNWKYRLGLFLSKYLVPRKVLSYIMARSIHKRTTP